MPRPFNPEQIKNWKVGLPAPLAGRVELALWDRINNKPAYGKRSDLIAELLELWVSGKLPTTIQPNPPE